jgi:peroxiredoxin
LIESALDGVARSMDAGAMADYESLPPDLPVPVDDGACDRLAGMRLPDISLESTGGGAARLLEVCAGRCVLYLYPRTGTPGVPLPDGWDLIPGARGCTPQSCGFRDHAQELRDLGASVVGVSSQLPEEQLEFSERVELPFPLLSDPTLLLARRLRLPTFAVEGMRLYRRVTMIVEDGVITKVFYPVFPPDRNAEEVLAWLST